MTLFPITPDVQANLCSRRPGVHSKSVTGEWVFKVGCFQGNIRAFALVDPWDLETQIRATHLHNATYDLFALAVQPSPQPPLPASRLPMPSGGQRPGERELRPTLWREVMEFWIRVILKLSFSGWNTYALTIGRCHIKTCSVPPFRSRFVASVLG